MDWRWPDRRPPGHGALVEMAGADGSFDPRDPAGFHLGSVRRVMAELRANDGGGDYDGARASDIRSRRSFDCLGERAGIDSRVGMARTVSMRRGTASRARSSSPATGDAPSGPPGAAPALFRSGVVAGPSSCTSLRLAAGAARASSPGVAGGGALGDVHNSCPNRCLICLSEERTATIVHGETGHVACCLTCARILKARGNSVSRVRASPFGGPRLHFFVFVSLDSSPSQFHPLQHLLVCIFFLYHEQCPVCRLPIDLVIQHFWA